MSAPVEIGFFSFSRVTDSGDHRAYNEWHQLDHMPEQYGIPGVVLGERWVSTPACRKARVFDAAALAASDYLTLYLMSEPVDETVKSFFELGKSLARAGRFYEHRRSLLSGPFRVRARRAAPRTLVSDQAVPFRPNLGVFAIVERAREPSASDGSQGGTAAESELTRIERLLDQTGVAGVWSFSPLGTDPRGSGAGELDLTICYLDEPPLEISRDLGETVRDLWGTSPHLAFAGPFEAIVPWKWDWFDQ